MDGRTRRAAVALCLASVLIVSGAVADLPRQAAHTGPAAPTAGERRDPSPQVVPDRYLVQTAGTPTTLGGSRRANAKARARLLATAARIGASVDRSYDATWTGVALTATPEQLDALLAVPGVEEAYPVYALSLADPVTDAPPAAPAGAGTTTGADPEATTSEDGPGPDAPAGDEPQPPAPPTASDDAVTVPYLGAEPVDVLANDTADAGVSLLPQSVRITTAGASPDGTRLEVPGQASYSVGADGRVTVSPVAGRVGALDPVTYAVTDSAGGTASATLTVTVATPAAPAAGDDHAAGTAGRPISVAVLDNDAATAPALLQAASLCLPDAETCRVFLDTPDGVWTAAAGLVGFSPAPGFTGTASTAYRVADELGQVAQASVTVTIHAAPAASDHAVTTDYLVPVEVDVLDDPQAPDAAPLDPTSLTLLDAAGEPVPQRDVPGEGSYTAGTDGRISFTPAPRFTGGATPVGYRFADTLGVVATARLFVSVSVPAPPEAADDTAAGSQAVPVTLDVLANDTAHSGALLDPASLCLTSGEDCVATTGDANGTWQVADGRLTFTSAPGFLGTARAGYRVADDLGRTAGAAVSVTVTSAPAAGDDRAHTAYRVPVEVDVLANDAPGSSAGGPGTIDAGSVRFANGERGLTTADGTWSADPGSGRVSFVPADGFSGDAVAGYTVTDSLGHTATATITVRVGAAPVAADDTATTAQGVPVELTPLANDTAGDDGDEPPAEVPLDPASVRLVDGEDVGTTLDAGAGTWTVTGGTVRFVPRRSFTGEAGIGYRVEDANGTAASASITVSVAAVTPLVRPDATGVPARHVATLDVLANDEPGHPGIALDRASVRFTDPAATDDGTALVTDAGTWLLPGEGQVEFTPRDDFSGATATTTYRVLDANGTPAEAAVSVRVGALTVALGAEATTAQNVTLVLDPRATVRPGDDGGDPAQPGVIADLVLTDGPDELRGPGRVLDDGDLIVENEGRWRLGAGGVEFNPESAFTGTAVAEFVVTDGFGNTATSRLVVHVSPINPVVRPDTAHTPANHPVTIPVLANDEHGAESAPLQPTIEIVSADSAKGSWTTTNGTLTFTPATNLTGDAQAQYRVRDANLTPGTATVTVRVGALPLALPDTPSVPQDGAPFTVTPLANDTAGDDGTGAGRSFGAGSLVLTGPGVSPDGKKLTSTAHTWAVQPDNTVTFTADWRFVGTASTSYRFTDGFGNTATATIVATVSPGAESATEKRLTAIGALLPAANGGLQVTPGGAGIKVGIIDSGVNYRHPDLGGTAASTFPTTRVRFGGDFTDGDADGDPLDCYGHGSHVAGIVGADGNPRRGGAFGVAPRATLGAYRVFDCAGEATTDDIVAAVERAALDGMNVVNLSLGASSLSWPNDTSYPLTQAAAALVKKGVVVVAAAGNSGARGLFTVGSPAVAPGVIAVAATNSTDTGIADYSALGPAADLSLSPTIAAPGTGVHSTLLGTATGTKDGTSMAAPEVAGAVAELLRAKGWTKPTAGLPAKVASLLYASANPLTAPGSGSVVQQGAGLLNLRQAIASPVTATPSTLRLGEGTTDTVTVTLTNSGTKAITYRGSLLAGTHVAPSTTGTDEGNQTPLWTSGSMGNAFSPATVTVPAGGTAKVKVTIKAPSVLSGRVGLLYGGWVQFTAAGAQTVSVPFLGVRGDYQDVEMLPSGRRSFSDDGVGYTLSLPGLARRDAAGNLFLLSDTRTFRPRRSDYPVLMFHLDYPATAIRVKAINQRTRRAYYAVLSGTSTTLGRRGRDESLSTLTFYGVVSKSGSRINLPSGTYKLQLRVLRPLGSSSASSHWDTWTSRTFKLSWTR